MKQRLASVPSELRQAAELISRRWLSWFQFLIVLGLMGLSPCQVEASHADVGQTEEVTESGLELRVVASGIKHPELFEEALADLDQGRIAKEVLGPNGELLGLWVPIDRKTAFSGRPGNYRWIPSTPVLLRDSATGRLIDPLILARLESDGVTTRRTMFLNDHGIAGIEVLVVADSFHLEPGQLRSLEASLDGLGRPCLDFQLQGEAVKSFYLLTESNVGESIAIIVDGRLVSAPNVNSPIVRKGQIIGDFTRVEIEEMIRLIDPQGRMTTAPTESGLLFDRFKGLFVPTVFGFIVIGMGVHYFFRRRTLLKEAEMEKNLPVAFPASQTNRDTEADDQEPRSERV